MRESIVEQTTRKPFWRWGVNRWIVLALLLIGGFIIGQSVLTTPVLPSVVLPAEHLTAKPLFTLPVIGEFYFTNTMTATLLALALLFIMAFFFQRDVKRAINDGSLILKGFSSGVEALLEFLYNMTESTAGKWARTIFPWFGSITLLVLVANWMELFPLVDSFGLLEHAEHGGYGIQQLVGNLYTLVKSSGVETGYSVVPFVRVVSTDLNFTVALALTAVVAVQVMGIKAQGMKYFSKFFFVKTLFTKPIFGVIDFGVGLLELVSEFSKILSFAFRLFGNIFAGSVLLFVMGFLLGKFTLVPTIFYMLEVFVGAIQAVVFGMLTMTFMAQATQGHGSDDHAEKAHVKEAAAA
jgi:F-type H+-transporting ATPase subunit a